MTDFGDVSDGRKIGFSASSSVMFSSGDNDGHSRVKIFYLLIEQPDIGLQRGIEIVVSSVRSSVNTKIASEFGVFLLGAGDFISSVFSRDEKLGRSAVAKVPKASTENVGFVSA